MKFALAPTAAQKERAKRVSANRSTNPGWLRVAFGGKDTPSFVLAGGNDTLSESHHCAPVAQLDRAVASEATGREFESLRAHHKSVDFAVQKNPVKSLFVRWIKTHIIEASHHLQQFALSARLAELTEDKPLFVSSKAPLAVA